MQLAGIRLDAPWVTVLDVYGNPDGVVVYGAAAAAGAGMGGECWGSTRVGLSIEAAPDRFTACINL